MAVFALLYTVEIAGWRAIGEGALGGRLDSGWLAAWVLLLLTLVPLRLASGWLDAHLALATGRLLKQRLLAGALRLDLDLVRRLGTGQWLGRVMESQALEALALNGGLAVAVGLLELGFAAAVLALGAAAGWHLALLGAWLLLTVLLTRRYAARLRQWTAQRLAMTQDLVERMVGHRSGLAQDRPARRDARDDRTLADYQQQSRRLDDATTPIVAGLPGGWMLLALAGLAPALLAAPAQGPAAAHAAVTHPSAANPRKTPVWRSRQRRPSLRRSDHDVSARHTTRYASSTPHTVRICPVDGS